MTNIKIEFTQACIEEISKLRRQVEEQEREIENLIIEKTLRKIREREVEKSWDINPEYVKVLERDLEDSLQISCKAIEWLAHTAYCYAEVLPKDWKDIYKRIHKMHTEFEANRSKEMPFGLGQFKNIDIGPMPKELQEKLKQMSNEPTEK